MVALTAAARTALFVSSFALDRPAASSRHPTARLARRRPAAPTAQLPADPLPAIDARVVALAGPAAVALSLDPLMSALDAALVARLPDAAPLAELGGAAAAVGLSYSVFGFLVTNTAPGVAKRRAAGDDAAAAALARGALSAAAVLGTAVGCLLTAGGPFLLDTLVGVPPEAAPGALAVLKLRALGAPAVLTASAAAGAFRGFGDTKTPLLVAAGATLVNASLDYYLIFERHLGAQGAAGATAAAEWAAAAGLVVLLAPKWRGTGAGTGTGKGTRGGGGEAALSELKAAAPGAAWTFGRSASLQTALFAASAAAAGLGAVSLGAHQLALQLWLVSSFVLDSLAAAAQVLVAEALAAGRTAQARAVVGRLVQWALGGGFAFFGLYAALTPHLAAANADVTAALAAIVPVVLWMQPLNALVFLGDGVLQGAGAFRYEAGAMAASVAAAGAFAAWAGGADTLLGVWTAIAVLQGGRLLACGVWGARARRGGVLAGGEDGEMPR